MTDHRPEVRECLLEYMALADKICYTEPELSQYRAMKAKAKAALSVAEPPLVRACLEKLRAVARAARRFANAHSEAALAVKDGPEYRASCDELFTALESYESGKEK